MMIRFISDKQIKEIEDEAYYRGYEYGKNIYSDALERDFMRGRLTLNEYRRIKYQLPPIESSIEYMTREEHLDLHGHPGLGV